MRGIQTKTKEKYIGKRFGFLTVIDFYEMKNYRHYWRCLCDCGNEIIVRGQNLTNGNTQSCGCYHKKRASEANNHPKTHGLSNTRIYHCWQEMIKRCYTKTQMYYNDYGGRGITVCDRWLHSFENFYADMSNTYQEGLTLDRIDVNKGYSPDNCRWITFKQQQNNKRNNHLVTYNGETKTISEWADISGIPYKTLWNRFSTLGWSAEKAITTPSRKLNRR